MLPTCLLNRQAAYRLPDRILLSFRVAQSSRHLDEQPYFWAYFMQPTGFPANQWGSDMQPDMPGSERMCLLCLRRDSTYIGIDQQTDRKDSEYMVDTTVDRITKSDENVCK